MITCSDCRHEWIEPWAVESPPEPVARRDLDPDIQPLVLAARQARKAFMVQKRQRQIRVMAWAGLLFIAVSPFLGAIAFPERVVTLAPASIALHDWLGRDVNLYGLAINILKVEHLDIDGRPEITITGELTNIAGADRKVPWLRFGLKNESHAEVHAWQTDTGAQALKPGESRRFMTTLAAPPATARKVEIRFARADEIGSNTQP
jgi:hypothetical protein